MDNTDGRRMASETKSNGMTSMTSTNANNDCQAFGLNGRPIAMGLRRQPTKYPHGLNITVQTLEQSHYVENYSRASTLRSSDSKSDRDSWPESPVGSALESCQQKYRISMIGGPETLAELQVPRYKYPLTANYYLNAQDAKQTPLVLLAYAKHICRWKYMRWPIIFLACVLLFFGLITYCLWLHDVSVAREKYLQRRLEATSEFSDPFEDYTTTPTTTASTARRVELSNKLMTTGKSTTTTTTTTRTTLTASAAHANGLFESTRLRAIDIGAQKPQTQTTTTEEEEADSNDAVDSREEADIYSEGDYNQEDYETLPDDDDSLLPADSIRFTSGHQNSFGVPIEHDERILRLLKRLYAQPPTAASADASTVRTLTRVSPTIPPVAVAASKPTAAMTTPQESGCYSTTLAMCRGVLDYDLTYNASAQLATAELAAYEKLISANCSTRAVEFLCSALEPECRPLHIGQLPPCRRICKAVLEACSLVIVNSDTLIEMFDCNRYPDSSDAHKCEDPTRRRGFCYDNEFQCYDSTCIPYQWQCDNIKDCANGEDEDHCLICEQADEYRCRSNEKCVPDAARCDLKFDCFDGSDEDDCDNYGSGDDAGFNESEINAFPRIFSYASFLSPNQTGEKRFTYITATTDDRSGTTFQVHEVANRTSGISQEEVTNTVPSEGPGPKGFVNFRDSKEIMMTSDSENKFKYSAARANRSTSKFSLNTTPLRPAASQRIAVTTPAPVSFPPPTRRHATTECPPHQLRCVSGKCITVSQLCDKHIDCPDGADELMCIYRERPSARRQNQTTSTTTATATATAKVSVTTTTTTSITSTTVGSSTTNSTPTYARLEPRTIRTTVKRKPKT